MGNGIEGGGWGGFFYEGATQRNAERAQHQWNKAWGQANLECGGCLGRALAERDGKFKTNGPRIVAEYQVVIGGHGDLTPAEKTRLQKTGLWSALNDGPLQNALAIAAAIIVGFGGWAIAGGAGGAAIGTESAELLGSATRLYNSTLTFVGRALTKHPEVLSLTSATLRIAYRTDALLNAAGEGALRNILTNGTRTLEILGRYGPVIQYQLANSFGARFYPNGSFIGFINP